jgi:carbamate kinase
MAADVVPAPPLDVLGAESQGQIGYLMTQALHAAFLERGITREIAVVVSQVVVRTDDPAFQHPTKPVGPIYDEATARAHAAERGWSIAPDGKHWRRVVPSPLPLRIVEAPSIRTLVEAGVLVIASGGGGIPVAELADGRYDGREAVIDKDLAAVVLARSVGADGLLLLTDVDAVYRDWGTDHAEAIRRMSPDEAFAGLESKAWPAGSMGPKIRACAEFVQSGGRFAAIGRLEDAAALAWGRAGTRFGSGRLGLPPFTAPETAATKEGSAVGPRS